MMPEPGQRVRVVKMDDPWAVLPLDMEGTIDHLDSMGTIFVRWDNGSMLGLIPGVDEYEVLPPPAQD
jgi:hypothetical protein